MIPSENCYKLIESSEGLRLKAYQDTGGVWTIGYGHTGGVREGQVITDDTAVDLLRHDLAYAEGVVNQHALPATQGQFDALVDFVFNLGPTQVLHSTLLRYHLAGEYKKAAAEFSKWNHDNGRVIQGLTVRRAKERALYEAGSVVLAPAPFDKYDRNANV